VQAAAQGQVRLARSFMNWSNSAPVLGGPEPVEEVAEFALLLVELAQRLLAILVEGDVAAAAMAAPAGAPTAALFARSRLLGPYQRP